MSEKFNQPTNLDSKRQQIESFSRGMSSAVKSLGEQMLRQEQEASVTHTGEIEYPNGSTQVEIHKGLGSRFNWSEYKNNGGVGTRTDRTTELKRPLNSPPDKEGRVAVFFDNGKELYVQDGVGYIFVKDSEGKSSLAKSVAIEEITDITVGMRDSVILYEFSDDEHAAQATRITGKPTSVMLESYNPDIVDKA